MCSKDESWIDLLLASGRLESLVPCGPCREVGAITWVKKTFAFLFVSVEDGSRFVSKISFVSVELTSPWPPSFDPFDWRTHGWIGQGTRSPRHRPGESCEWLVFPLQNDR